MAVTTKTEAYTVRSLGEGKPLSRQELLRASLVSLPVPSSFRRPIGALNGVGERTTQAAGRLGIETLEDLLEHLPVRHDDLSEVRSLANLAAGEDATVLVSIQSCRIRPTRRRNLRLFECIVTDDSLTVTAVWFNQNYLLEQLGPGSRVLLHGRLERDKKAVTFRVKSHEIVGSNASENLVSSGAIHTLGLVPVYAATEGLGPRRIRALVLQAGGQRPNLVDPLPSSIRVRAKLPARSDAVAAVHFPQSFQDATCARRRLAFEELLLLQLALGIRRGRRQSIAGAEIPEAGELVGQWLESLPFKLTGDQLKAVSEVGRQLIRPQAMQTLLMGEVGSGKTVVALYAMLRAVESGGQAALMAPTETLAEQHFQTVDRLTGSLERVALLTSSTPAARRRQVLSALRDGSLHLLVGTHALIEDKVEFDDLRLAVVDEQHRFGVEQRAALDRKRVDGLTPHVLHMSATPIPRTLALTVFGDLDSITLRELPKGRQAVKTWAVPEQKRAGAYEFIRQRLREGRQCFIVCPLVEESEEMQAKAATAEGERLTQGEFRHFNVAVLHGQMTAKDKQSRMLAFVEGSVDLMVATSVIEVGIDVPNATIMVIEEADRFGLSQLHQLRGRVGRGEHQSHCLLFADPRSEQAQRRIEALVNINDGFELAEVDLDLRGEGEILGKRQSGLPDLRAASLPRDQDLLVEVREIVRSLLRDDPALERPHHILLEIALRKRLGADGPAVIAA